MSTFLKVCASMMAGETEEVDAPGDVEVDAARPDDWRVMSNGSAGGSAESVAFVRCWFCVRRHVLSVAMSASGSGI